LANDLVNQYIQNKLSSRNTNIPVQIPAQNCVPVNQIIDKYNKNINQAANDRFIRSDISRKHTTQVNDSKLNHDINQVKKYILKGDELIQQVNKLDQFIKKPDNTVVTGVISAIPGARRLVQMEDNYKEGNKLKTVGLGAIALINLKEDARDLLTLLGRTKSSAPKGYFSKFRFFAGTIIENWLRERKWGQFILDKLDKSLNETEFADNLYQRLKIEKDLDKFDKEIKWFRKKEIVPREYIKFEGAFWKKLTGLTLCRITKIGLITAALLEIPTIYKASKKKDHKKIIKSGLNSTVPIICGALTSSFLALSLENFTYASSAGSILGLGLGLYIGRQLINKLIKDK